MPAHSWPKKGCQAQGSIILFLHIHIFIDISFHIISYHLISIAQIQFFCISTQHLLTSRFSFLTASWWTHDDMHSVLIVSLSCPYRTQTLFLWRHIKRPTIGIWVVPSIYHVMGDHNCFVIPTTDLGIVLAWTWHELGQHSSWRNFHNHQQSTTNECHLVINGLVFLPGTFTYQCTFQLSYLFIWMRFRVISLY